MSDNPENNKDSDDYDDLNMEVEEISPSLKQVGLPTGKRITLFFRSTIGAGEKIEKLVVDSNIPISELKKTVGNLFDLEPDDFHFSFAGRTTDNDDILSNYDIEDGSEALIIPISLAG